MSSLPKCRRFKRPTTLAKRSALAKKSFYNKRSYKSLYEKIKDNNNALAKALSKEKQENQYLFSENLALTSRIQELEVACNRCNDVIFEVSKNAKDSLGLVVTATNYITNTIASCQQFFNTPQYTPRRSSTNTADRRDSNRRLSGKSPARGVVQPMVSGHMITKPTINLRRLNLQREYRDRNRPNLSDIQESGTTPEQSPGERRSASPAQLSIPRTLNYVSRRMDRMPERLRRTLRTSDESPRRSSGRGVRNSGRHSLRRSRERSDVSPVRINNDESLRSPRVSLHDVSRLLHNAQSVNIRTLLDASREMELAPSTVSPERAAAAAAAAPEEDSSTETGSQEALEKSSENPTGKHRREWSVRQDLEDPLEGPSWLLNDSEVEESPSSPASRTIERRTNGTRFTNDSIEETETVEMAAPAWLNRDSDEYRNWDDDDDVRTDSNLPMFVTRKRGSRCDDPDDFTLLWRKQPAKNYNFDINDLKLPVIESPIVKAPEVQIAEPEMTANIQTVQTQNFTNLTFCRPIVDPDEETMYQLPTAPPPLSDNSNIFAPSPLAQRERLDDDDDDDDDDDNNDNNESLFSLRRKRQHKKSRLRVLESPSDSDYSPTQEHKKSKSKKKLKTKDPSSAKVVLLKLKDERITKYSVSPERRQPQEDYRNKAGQASTNPDPSSDSEMSNTGSTKLAASTTVPGRPRRLAAPTNLQEPSLGMKLRRK